jgi:hypothetical protein
MSIATETNKEIYYARNSILVRNSRLEDIYDLFWRMRISDIQEIYASHHATPKEALKRGFKNSFICLSIILNGKVIAMFGCSTEYLCGDRATIWLLAAPELEQIKLRFLKNSKKFIKLFLEYYPILENFVDARNTKSIEWLKFCGAELEDPKPYGKEQLPFRYFSFKRGE